MEVPFIDFSQQYQIIKEEIDVGLKSVFERGAFILGQEEKDFELDFARYCDASYGIGVNSGNFLGKLAKFRKIRYYFS